MKKRTYCYQWLDELVNQNLNPFIVKEVNLSAEHFEDVSSKIALESVNAIRSLKEQVFKSDKESHIKTTVKRYYDAAVSLITNAYTFRRHEKLHTYAQNLHEHVVQNMEKIVDHLEQNYSEYIDAEYKMPLTRLVEIKERIESQREVINTKLAGGTHGTEPVYIVNEVLDAFVHKVNGAQSISHHEGYYISSLVEDILNVDIKPTITGCPALHELLIYWNLNSKSCISYFTHGLEAEIAKYDNEEKKLEYIRLQLKNVRQLPVKPDTVFDPSYPGIAEYFLSWMENEVEYRENRKKGFRPLPMGLPSEPVSPSFKVMINKLSSDQIALLLRAADDLRYLGARSLSAVFQTIVPHISTNTKENLSWNNMRTKSYVAESTDKESTIKFLTEMIGKIKEY